MRPYRPPSVLLPRCSQCLHRTISTTATATRKRRKARDAQKQTDRDLQERAAVLRARIRDARIARREDWMLGPLAPRRDKGHSEYGTVSARELEGVKGGLGRGVLTERGRGGVSAAAAGKKGGVGRSWRESLIYEGDRVAVVSGTGPESREKGRIGVVEAVRRERRDVLIKDLNPAYIKALSATEAGLPLIQERRLTIPLSSIRLVHKIPDPLTGISTDKIIERLIPLPDEAQASIRAEFAAGAIGQKELIHRLRGRTIPGSKEVYKHWLEIPLPNPQHDSDDSRKRKAPKPLDNDTQRFEVEARTWTPTLLRAPMPGGVIDELRNKYSRFRTRHDAGYQLALDNRARRKAEYEAWARSGGGVMVTPRMEARQKEREVLKGRGEPVLERALLERIGEVMKERGW
ncbi:hypothetical protein IMSHALPRED_001938 [Imshaugia aleurites]|uniref:KOW domain-containing protein n=1 Tax=Imshaugia aleurites TaxID=172621 RepID=A0A8H3IBE9_9LECA|nr:hypothetical protein IMSHALPRED_001938 [Imshaugia aleurites]